MEQSQEQLQEKQDSEIKYILQHDRPNCIGCAACEAVAPDFWEMNVDGKSDIKSARNLENGWQQLEINEKNFQENKTIAKQGGTIAGNTRKEIEEKTGKKVVSKNSAGKLLEDKIKKSI